MAEKFEWDEQKARGNVRKHGVSFDEAASVFNDPAAITIFDPDIPTTKIVSFCSANLTGAGSWWWCSPTAKVQCALLPHARPTRAKGNSMKKAPKQPDPDLRDNYDFSKGVRGKYTDRNGEGSVLVVLAPDVAKFFPTAKAVNAALRALVKIAKRTPKQRSA